MSTPTRVLLAALIVAAVLPAQQTVAPTPDPVGKPRGDDVNG